MGLYSWKLIEWVEMCLVKCAVLVLNFISAAVNLETEILERR